MSRFLFATVTFLASLSSLARAAPPTVSRHGGFIPFRYNGEVFQTWCIYYSEPAISLLSRPIVVLHGGPGFSHDYMDPLKDLAGNNRPVILYDQIGNGRSTRLPGKPTSFWSIDLFVAELENVIRFFSPISYDIVGHSWGGMLAAEYASRHPPFLGFFGLRRMVLTDASPQKSLSAQSQAQLLKQFPGDVQQAIMAGWEDPPRYRWGLQEFFQVHGCTLSPWPVELISSFDALFEDPTVSQQTSITLSNWTIIDRLHDITVPTLVINGAKDFIQDFVVQLWPEKLPHVTYHKFQNSSHTPFFEERQSFMTLVSRFLE